MAIINKSTHKYKLLNKFVKENYHINYKDRTEEVLDLFIDFKSSYMIIHVASETLEDHLMMDYEYYKNHSSNWNTCTFDEDYTLINTGLHTCWCRKIIDKDIGTILLEEL